MSPGRVKLPKAIKFMYRNKERLWLKVNKLENNYYYGCVDSKPISKGITYNQYVKKTKTMWWKQNIEFICIKDL